jgi:hypothetical protein
MTPFRARLILCAIMALFLATAANALFLQDRVRLLRGNGLPSTAESVIQFPLDKPFPPDQNTLSTPSEKPESAFSKTGKATDLRLQIALQRELARRGYSELLQAPSGLSLAALAYEFDNGLPLTGEVTERLFKRVLFDLNQAPRGLFADRAETNAKLVMEIQNALLGLGFFSGTLSGRMDIWTANAIKAFERHRKIPITGRLTEATLLELISYSGQRLLVSSR